MSWSSFSEWEHGNSDNYQVLTDAPDHLDQIRPEDWVTKESKDSPSSELESEEVEEKRESPKVLSTVNQSDKVLMNLKPTTTSDLLLKEDVLKLLTV